MPALLDTLGASRRVAGRRAGLVRRGVPRAAGGDPRHLHARAPEDAARARGRARSPPHFLAVCDQTGDPKGLIARGNEWVTAARFSDARFFWDDDGKTRLEDRLRELGTLQFQETLGDYLKKTGRIQELAERLAARLGLVAPRRPMLVRAARLLKADLVTDMVREFPDLQGVVGGLYARREGEPEEVWQALYDQYRPASADDAVPRGDVGGARGPRRPARHAHGPLRPRPRADRLEGPVRAPARGAGRREDPPRQEVAPRPAGGVLGRRSLLHGSLPRKRDEVLPELNAFLLERLRFLLEKRGFAPDEIEAVLTTDCRDVADAAERVAAVAAVRKEQDFVPLATAFKRIQNILAQAEDEPAASPTRRR